MPVDIFSLASKARKSLSSYCMNECNALCCRKGFINISLKEAKRITQKKVNEFEVLGYLFRKNGRYALNLGMACPSLKDNKCTIHKSRNRPKVCSDFPVFIEGNEIKLSMNCPAVANNFLYPYEKKFIKLGYKITN